MKSYRPFVLKIFFKERGNKKNSRMDYEMTFKETHRNMNCDEETSLCAPLYIMGFT